MSLSQVIFSKDVVFAFLIYALLIAGALPCFDRIHKALAGSVLVWPWEHIGMPLLRSLLILVFIALSYPLIFAITEAPAFSELINTQERRANHLLNLLFLLALCFPALPLIGEREEIILPLQAIAGCALVFSWLAAELGIVEISYWPGTMTTLAIVALAFINHWLAQSLAHYLGKIMLEKMAISEADVFFSRALVMLLQSPAILLFSTALGRQLP